MPAGTFQGQKDPFAVELYIRLTNRAPSLYLKDNNGNDIDLNDGTYARSQVYLCSAFPVPTIIISINVAMTPIGHAYTSSKDSPPRVVFDLPGGALLVDVVAADVPGPANGFTPYNDDMEPPGTYLEAR